MINRNRFLFIIRILTALYFGLIVFIIVCATQRWFHWIFTLVQQNTSDKLMHFVLVGTLSLLLNLSFCCRCVRIGNWQVQLASILLILLFTLEEFSQQFFRNRTFDLLDLSCNLLGIVVFGFLAAVIWRWWGESGKE